jgi:transposase InsO family protein
MPWKETCAMEQRLRFIAEHERAEVGMAELCRAYSISRKTGYKWIERYQLGGLPGLANRSRAPHHRPGQLDPALAERFLAARAAHPTWGPRKLVAWLGQRDPTLTLPAASTVGDLLRRAGLTVPRRRARARARGGGPLGSCSTANAVWCADFKGQFRTEDGSLCYPLTVSDAASRYFLRCQVLPGVEGARVRPLLEATFREYGLPIARRTDNGPPFGSTGLAGLTELVVWLVELGIRPDRGRPGHPQDNGRHERLHRTLQAETVLPPAADPRAQQAAFDAFRREYNQERPHEALGQRPPASVYTPSPRPYPARLAPPEYPTADLVKRVRPNGTLRWRGAEVYLAAPLAGRPVGLTDQGDGQWAVAFGALLLGVLDERAGRLIPARGPRWTASGVEAVLPMSSV